MTKYTSYYFAIIFLLLGHLGIGQTDYTASQISNSARHIADSICQTRMLCKSTKIEFTETIHYPKPTDTTSNRNTDIYFFTYKVYIKEDIESELNISIWGDLSIKYISGVPDTNYAFLPCNMMSREALWKIAKKNGLKTKFKFCKYHLVFDDNGLYIKFIEKKSKWDADLYTLDAITGQFIGHVQMNVNI